MSSVNLLEESDDTKIDELCIVFLDAASDSDTKNLKE